MTRIGSDLGAQPLGARALKIVQGRRIGHGQHTQRNIGGPDPVLGLRRSKGPLAAPRRIRRQLGGHPLERRRRRQTAASPCLARRTLEPSGHLLVEPGSRERTVPRPPIGIELGVGHLGQCPMDALTLQWRGGPVDGSSGERMTELHLALELNEPGSRRRQRDGIYP